MKDLSGALKHNYNKLLNTRKKGFVIAHNRESLCSNKSTGSQNTTIKYFVHYKSEFVITTIFVIVI